MNKRTWLLALLSATAVLTGCATSSPQPATVADTIARTPELSMAAQLIEEAGLTATLRGDGPFTVLAPSNAAFQALPAAQLAELRSHKEQLKAVLSYHVIPAQITSAAVPGAAQKTLQGGTVALAKAGSVMTVEHAIVTRADLKASNGTVNVIDAVLTPPKKR